MYIQMIDVKLLFILWNLSIIVIASYDAVETTDEKLSTSSLKNDILSNPQETPNIQNDNEGTNSCREISLHRCGSSMVRVFRLLDFLPWKKSFEAKCALRNAFFTCMKLENEPCKKHQWRINRSSRFRKKLVRSLWSTRGCILGLKNDGTHV
ncbi:uncharacterized protein LOC129984322 isoform X1 [Argiope bruennichi]|uniref:uncharacterized protein LOC129984322 isoform X1 n=1 Tax=Argiope bruennichi TaxID=94029 RepID=UPI00249511FF|nr:uncharacterized protein LOC129984322 isoform X1 [Argiope bruennichi]